MNLQYISDNEGKTTGVFIPISDWNLLKDKFENIEEIDIPDWQKKEVQSRLVDYKNDPKQAMDFNIVINEIENDL